MKISLLKDPKNAPMELLLLADPSEDLINQYLPDSFVIVAETKEEIVGICVLLKKGDHEMEVMNLAVKETNQKQGIGKSLLLHAIDFADSNQIKKLWIGTADSSFHQLKLYRKIGFEEVDRIANFFVDHYEEPIYENGLQARDMVRLQLTIS